MAGLCWCWWGAQDVCSAPVLPKIAACVYSPQVAGQQQQPNIGVFFRPPGRRQWRIMAACLSHASFFFVDFFSLFPAIFFLLFLPPCVCGQRKRGGNEKKAVRVWVIGIWPASVDWRPKIAWCRWTKTQWTLKEGKQTGTAIDEWQRDAAAPLRSSHTAKAAVERRKKHEFASWSIGNQSNQLIKQMCVHPSITIRIILIAGLSTGRLCLQIVGRDVLLQRKCVVSALRFD